MKKLLEQDMHIHTTASDGEYSPLEIYQKIKETGQITTFAITDHDTVTGAIALQKYLDNNPDETITYIPGIEITTNIQNPKYKMKKSKLHVLGYNFDLNHPAIQEIIKRRRIINIKFLKAQIKSLKDKFGIEFSQKELEKIFKKSHFNRVDLAIEIINQGKAEMVDEAYEKYLDPAKTPIPLMPIYEEEVFSAIKEAGGYVSLAHPTSLKLSLEELREYIEYLKTIGLDAIEVYHSEQKRKYSNSLIKIARELDLYISGGSDYHGPKVKPTVHLGLDKGRGRTKVLTLAAQIKDNK